MDAGRAAPKFHETCPGIRPEPSTAEFRRGPRPLADGRYDFRRYDFHCGGVDIGDGYRVQATLGRVNDLPEKAGPVRLGEDLTMTCTADARARRSAGRIGAVPRSADGPMLGTDRKGGPIAGRVPTWRPKRGAHASRRGLNPFLRAHA